MEEEQYYIIKLKKNYGFILPKMIIENCNIELGYYSYTFKNGQLIMKYVCPLTDLKNQKIDNIMCIKKSYCPVIPKSLRWYFIPESRLLVSYKNDSLKVRLLSGHCVFCGKETNLNDFANQKICRSCISLIIDTFTGI